MNTDLADAFVKIALTKATALNKVIKEATCDYNLQILKGKDPARWTILVLLFLIYTITDYLCYTIF